MSWHKYEPVPTEKIGDIEYTLFVCDNCGVIVKTNGEEPKACPVCGEGKEKNG